MRRKASHGLARCARALPSGNTLLLARLLLVHRHLDSGTRKLLPLATVKVALASEQTRERERVFGFKTGRQRFVWRSAGRPPKTLTRPLPRATPLKKRITVVDTVPKATRTPPPVPIRARASECVLLSRAREETASCTCV